MRRRHSDIPARMRRRCAFMVLLTGFFRAAASQSSTGNTVSGDFRASTSASASALRPSNPVPSSYNTGGPRAAPERPNFDYPYRTFVRLRTRPEQIADSIAPIDLSFYVDYNSPQLWRIDYFNFLQVDYHIDRNASDQDSEDGAGAGGPRNDRTVEVGSAGAAGGKSNESGIKNATKNEVVVNTVPRKKNYKYLYRNGERVCLTEETGDPTWQHLALLPDLSHYTYTGDVVVRGMLCHEWTSGVPLVEVDTDKGGYLKLYTDANGGAPVQWTAFRARNPVFDAHTDAWEIDYMFFEPAVDPDSGINAQSRLRIFDLPKECVNAPIIFPSMSLRTHFVAGAGGAGVTDKNRLLASASTTGSEAVQEVAGGESATSKLASAATVPAAGENVDAQESRDKELADLALAYARSSKMGHKLDPVIRLGQLLHAEILEAELMGQEAHQSKSTREVELQFLLQHPEVLRRLIRDAPLLSRQAANALTMLRQKAGLFTASGKKTAEAEDITSSSSTKTKHAFVLLDELLQANNSEMPETSERISSDEIPLLGNRLAAFDYRAAAEGLIAQMSAGAAKAPRGASGVTAGDKIEEGDQQAALSLGLRGTSPSADFLPSGTMPVGDEVELNPNSFAMPEHKSKVLHDATKMEESIRLVLPRYYDLRFLLGPVKDQGICGSCWSFAFIAAVEGALAQGGERLDNPLSEQFILDCAWGQTSHACDGGNAGAEEMVGIPIPEGGDYGGYLSVAGRCHEPLAAQAVVTHWVLVPPIHQAIKAALFLKGILAVVLFAGPDVLYYAGGVIDVPACEGITLEQTDHAVALTGYDDDGGVAGIPFWTVRNSWSTAWGELGYFRIAQARDCGVSLQPAYAKLAESRTDESRMKGHSATAHQADARWFSWDMKAHYTELHS